MSRMFDIRESKLYFNSNGDSRNRRFLFNFSHLIQVEACRTDQCTKMLVYLKVNILESNQTNLIDEYYSLVNKQLILKSTVSSFKSISLIRLKTFNQNQFSLKKKSNLFQINSLTNVLSVDLTNFNEATLSNMIEIQYEPNKKLLFNLSFENLNHVFAADLTIDLFYYINKPSQRVYLGDLTSNKDGLICELWTSDEFIQVKLRFLNNSCELILESESVDLLTKQHQLKFQVSLRQKVAG